MSEMSFKINMECDSDGYVTFECPFCGSTFGLRADEVKTEDGMIDELFCPYCGLTKDTNAFWTIEVLQQINDIASNYMAEQLNKLFGNMVRDTNRQHGIIKMRYTPLKKVGISELRNNDGAEVPFECDCCNRHVKVLYDAGESMIYCPYCGVNV